MTTINSDIVMEEKKIEVKFLTSLALAHEDMDNVLRHFQITLVQEVESKKFRCYFDVVDPTKIKLKEE